MQLLPAWQTKLLQHVHSMAFEPSFIEFTYNGNLVSTLNVEQTLTKLGFVQRTRHIRGVSSIWTQNQCILFVTNNPQSRRYGITGLGFLCAVSDLESLNTVTEPNIDMQVLDDPGGLRFLFVTDRERFGGNRPVYEVVDTSPSKDFQQYYSGMLYGSTSKQTLENLSLMGFTTTKSGDHTISMVSENKRFTLIVDQRGNTGVRTVITDTDDVFKSTAGVVGAGFEFTEFTDVDVSQFGKLAHRIRGYNCMAYGSENSHGIENYLPKAYGATGQVYRMRKQYIHFNERVLLSYG